MAWSFMDRNGSHVSNGSRVCTEAGRSGVAEKVAASTTTVRWEDGGSSQVPLDALDEKPQLVLVEWEISTRLQPSTEWQHLTEVEPGSIILCRSVGYLLKNGQDVMVLAPNLSTEKNARTMGVISIPTRRVTEVTALDERDEPDERTEAQKTAACAAAVTRAEMSIGEIDRALRTVDGRP